MKKGLALLAALLVALAGCAAGQPQEKPMKLHTAQVSDEERQALLPPQAGGGAVYDYETDGTIKSLHIQFQTLEDGKWREIDSSSAEVSKPTGRLALSYLPEDGNLRIAYELGTGSVGLWSAQPEELPKTADLPRVMDVWLGETDILPDSPQVVGLQYFSESGRVPSGSLDDYDDVAMLQANFDAVNAVTVTFSQKEIQ